MWRIAQQWGIAFVVFCCCFDSRGIVAAEEKAATGGKSGKSAPGASLTDSLSLTSRHEPIHIRSRDLEFRYEEKRIIYRGDVVAVQGDVTMKSDLLTVNYEDAPAVNGVQSKTEKPGDTEKSEQPEGTANATTKQRLKEIIAEGNVEILSGDRRATGKKAVFNEANRTVVLSGNARVQEVGNWVSGEKVTVYLDEKRSVVEGGERQAEMEIIPEQQGAEKKGAKKP